MITSPDSPPIGIENTIKQQTFVSHKLTPKIDKAVNKIKATKPDSTKQDTSKLKFLDNQTSETTKNTKDQNEEIIEKERQRIRIEQANIISIIPADTNTNTQLEQNIKDTTQQQHNTPTNIPTSLRSLKSSTSSQEHKYPPLSPELDDISDLNSENLKESDETF